MLVKVSEHPSKWNTRSTSIPQQKCKRENRLAYFFPLKLCFCIRNPKFKGIYKGNINTVFLVIFKQMFKKNICSLKYKSKIILMSEVCSKSYQFITEDVWFYSTFVWKLNYWAIVLLYRIYIRTCTHLQTSPIIVQKLNTNKSIRYRQTYSYL